MQLRYLNKVTLMKGENIPQKNGELVLEYKNIKDYNVQVQNLEDEVSASVYGSNINKMLRLKSPNKLLEKFLMPKVSNKQDNISNYYISYEDSIYKISAVNSVKIDIERI